MRKKIHKWLSKIEDKKIREQALNNIDDEFIGEEEVNSIADAIMSAFIWKDSPEGHSYWSSIYDRI